MTKMSDPFQGHPLHRFVRDINYNFGGRRTAFLQAPNPFHWVNENYGNVIAAMPEAEFNQMVDNAKIIFPSLHDNPDLKLDYTDSKFAAHIVALYTDQPVTIPNEDVIVL